MEKKKYLLTVRIEFDAFDDIDARKLAKVCIGTEFNYGGEKQEIKLQNIFIDKQPRTIGL